MEAWFRPSFNTSETVARHITESEYARIKSKAGKSVRFSDETVKRARRTTTRKRTTYRRTRETFDYSPALIAAGIGLIAGVATSLSSQSSGSTLKAVNPNTIMKQNPVTIGYTFVTAANQLRSQAGAVDQAFPNLSSLFAAMVQSAYSLQYEPSRAGQFANDLNAFAHVVGTTDSTLGSNLEEIARNIAKLAHTSLYLYPGMPGQVMQGLQQKYSAGQTNPSTGHGVPGFGYGLPGGFDPMWLLVLALLATDFYLWRRNSNG